MRKFFVHLGLVLSLAALAVSCDKPEKEPEAKTKFEVQQDVVDVDATGGSASVDFVLENPIDGVEVVAQSTSEWVSDFQVSGTQVVFTVAENTEAEIREAEVNVVYGDLSDKFVVRQAGLEEIVLQFTINIYDIAQTSTSFDITPTDLEATYFYTGVDKEYMDGFADDEAYFQDDLDYLEYIAESYGMTLEEVLAEFLVTGEQKGLALKDLTPESSYYIYAYGMTMDAERTSDIYREEFTTLAAEKIEASFEITYNIDVANVEMTVVPDSESYRYYYDIFSQSDLDETGMTIEENVQDILSANISFGQMFGMTLEEILDALLTRGTTSSTYELRASTDYVGFAVAVDDAGLVCSDASQSEFTTEEVLPSDNVITLTVVSVSAGGAVFDIATTNDDQYVFAVAEKEQWSTMSDEEILAELTEGDYGLSSMVQNGSKTGFQVNKLTPETTYYAFAFGYMAGVSTTDLTKVEFTTTEAGDPTLLTFTFNITDITEVGANVTVTGDPIDATYYFDIAAPEFAGADIISTFEEEIAYWIEQGWYTSAAEYWAGILSRGEDSWNYTNLDPATTWRAYAFGVNETTGEIVTEVSFSEEFTTLGSAETAQRMSVTGVLDSQKIKSYSRSKVAHQAVEPLQKVQKATIGNKVIDLKTKQSTSVSSTRYGLSIEK